MQKYSKCFISNLVGDLVSKYLPTPKTFGIDSVTKYYNNFSRVFQKKLFPKSSQI